MPKKILYESAVHQFLSAGKRLQRRLHDSKAAESRIFADWINAVSIKNAGSGTLLITWSLPTAGQYSLAYKNARFYTRGDSQVHASKQEDAGMTFREDPVMAQNVVFFDHELDAVLALSGALPGLKVVPGEDRASQLPSDAERKHAEEIFHDEWALHTDITKIDVRLMNEACTAPEMRYIRKSLGELRGRTLLDVGCGLGEASVYFALLGADVTATDISPGMCRAANDLAVHNKVGIKTHVSAAEDLGLPDSSMFDIIYTGNTLHHVDIATTMPKLLRHLKPDGIFVSWDPVAYNPLINIYRSRAMEVRTEDEHPLRLKDIRAVRRQFRTSSTAWFWLTTLLVFCAMAVIQRRDPNKERFWKKVIEESDRWAWMYRPLELIDKVLLLLPFLRPLCWNVVIIGRGPRPPHEN